MFEYFVHALGKVLPPFGTRGGVSGGVGGMSNEDVKSVVGCGSAETAQTTVKFAMVNEAKLKFVKEDRGTVVDGIVGASRDPKFNVTCETVCGALNTDNAETGSGDDLGSGGFLEANEVVVKA